MTPASTARGGVTPVAMRACLRCSFLCLHDSSQPLQSAMHVGLHRSLWSIQRIGRLRYRKAHDVPEHHRATLRVARAPRRRSQARSSGRSGSWWPWMSLSNSTGVGRLARSRRAFPAQVERNRPHPTVEFETTDAGRVVGLQGPVGADEGLLGKVLGFRPVDPAEARVERVLHLANQIGKGLVEIACHSVAQVVHHRLEPRVHRIGCTKSRPRPEIA